MGGKAIVAKFASVKTQGVGAPAEPPQTHVFTFLSVKTQGVGAPAEPPQTYVSTFLLFCENARRLRAGLRPETRIFGAAQIALGFAMRACKLPFILEHHPNVPPNE